MRSRATSDRGMRSESNAFVFTDGVYGLGFRFRVSGKYSARRFGAAGAHFRAVVRLVGAVRRERGDGHQRPHARRDDDLRSDLADLYGAHLSGLRLDDRKPDAHWRHRVQFHPADLPTHDLRRGGARAVAVRAAAHRDPGRGAGDGPDPADRVFDLAGVSAAVYRVPCARLYGFHGVRAAQGHVGILVCERLYPELVHGALLCAAFGRVRPALVLPGLAVRDRNGATVSGGLLPASRDLPWHPRHSRLLCGARHSGVLDRSALDFAGDPVAEERLQADGAGGVSV